ncbi:MAG: DUF2934 domain-containing protein [Geminicoccaceae bacterium]
MARNPPKTRAAEPAGAETPPAPDELGLDEVDTASVESMDASDPPAFGGVTGVGSGSEDRQQTIARRAYELWHQDGCPEGRALDYWLAAERESSPAVGELGATD